MRLDFLFKFNRLFVLLVQFLQDIVTEVDQRVLLDLQHRLVEESIVFLDHEVVLFK